MPDVDLRIRIKADGTAELVATGDGLKKVGERASAAQEQLDKFNETLLKGVGIGAGFEIGEKLAEGLLKAGEAFVEATKEAVEFSHHIELLAEKTGISTTAWQEFDVAARMSGTTIDNVSSAIAKMDGALEKGSTGFQRLGLDTAELLKESPQQAFQETAEALAGVGNQMERVADAKLIFGKAGADALPFIEQMAEGARIAHEFGLVLSEEDVEATAALAKSGQELSVIWDGLVRQFVAGAAGGADFKTFLDELSPAVNAAGEVMRMYGEQIKAVVMVLDGAAHYGGILDKIKESQFLNYNTKGDGKFINDPKGGEAPLPDSIDAIPISPEVQAKANAALKALRVADKLDLKELAQANHDVTQQLTEEEKERAKIYKRDADAALTETERILKAFGSDTSVVGSSVAFGKVADDFKIMGGAAGASIGQIEQFRQKLDTIANSSDDSTATVREEWGALVESGTAVKDHLIETGQAIEVGNGLWEKNGVAAGDALDKQNEGLKKVNQDLIDHIAHLEKVALKLSGVASIAGAASGLFQELGMSAESAGAKILSGVGGLASSGAGIASNLASGNILGAVASGIQGLTSLVGTVESLFGPSLGEKIGADLGHAVSDGLVKAIGDTQTKDKVNRTLAEYLHADDIFKETGDSSKIFDLMNADKNGLVNAKEAVDELGKSFTDLKTAADGGSLSSESAMAQMTFRARQLGEAIPAIDAAVKGMADDAVKSLADLIGGQGSSFTKDKNGKATIGGSITADQASADSDIFGVAFQMKSAQDGVVAAAEAMQGSIDDLVAKLPAGSSLTGGAAEAAYYSEMAKNPLYAGANKSAVAAAHIDKDAIDSGYASDVTGKAFSATAVGDYNQAYAAAGGIGGGDQARIAAEQAVLPLLTQLQKDSALGIKISPEAKSLLAAANKDGMLPALDVATQSLGYLKDIAANTSGGKVPVGSYSATGGSGGVGGAGGQWAGSASGMTLDDLHGAIIGIGRDVSMHLQARGIAG